MYYNLFFGCGFTPPTHTFIWFTHKTHKHTHFGYNRYIYGIIIINNLLLELTKL